MICGVFRRIEQGPTAGVHLRSSCSGRQDISMEKPGDQRILASQAAAFLFYKILRMYYESPDKIAHALLTIVHPTAN
jgi:hypothetical protein